MKDTGWQPREGSRVRILPHPKAAPDDPPPPDGVWMVLSRAPEHTNWWLYAQDDDARAWCLQHRAEVQSNCISVPNRRMSPVNTVRL